MKPTNEELAFWEKQLDDANLSMSRGEDPHVVKYGFTSTQLDLLPGIPAHVHQASTLLNLQELNRQRNSSRTKRRAKIRGEKSRLHAAIWGKKSTT